MNNWVKLFGGVQPRMGEI